MMIAVFNKKHPVKCFPMYRAQVSRLPEFFYGIKGCLELNEYSCIYFIHILLFSDVYQ